MKSEKLYLQNQKRNIHIVIYFFGKIGASHHFIEKHIKKMYGTFPISVGQTAGR